MNTKTWIGTTVSFAAGLLVLASTALAAGPQSIYLDANERAAVAPGVQTSVSVYADANQRSQIVSLGSSAGLAGYDDAAQRTASASVASAQSGSFTDAFERSTPPTAPLPQPTHLVAENGFDWNAAAIGASSMLMVAFLLGASMILARRSRGRLVVH